MSGDQIISIIQITGPLLFGVVLAWIAYKYKIKQQVFENKQEYYKRVRKASANMIVLWKDLNEIHLLLKEDTKENQILIESNMVSEFLELDDRKINFLEEGFNEAVEVIQELDSVLYSKIEDVFDRFRGTIDEVFNPLVYDPKLDYERKIEIALPVISDLDDELLADIKELITRLPKNERTKINDYIKKLQTRAEDQRVEVPKFIINLINRQFKPHENFTQDEIITFFSNDTVKWAYTKIGTTGIYKQLFNGGFMNLIKLLSMNQHDVDKWFDRQFSGNDFSKSLDQFTITEEEENNYLKNNRSFYIMLLEIVRKISGPVSYKTIRMLVKLNTGQVSMREEIEKLKKSRVKE